jgi:hypothetical protein
MLRPQRRGIWAFAPRPVAPTASREANAASSGRLLNLAAVRKERQINGLARFLASLFKQPVPVQKSKLTLELRTSDGSERLQA